MRGTAGNLTALELREVSRVGDDRRAVILELGM